MQELQGRADQLDLGYLKENYSGSIAREALQGTAISESPWRLGNYGVWLRRLTIEPISRGDTRGTTDQEGYRRWAK